MGSDEIVAELAVEGAEVVRLEALAAEAKKRRDRLILKAFAADVPRAEIAVAAKLSQPMVYKLNKEAEEKRAKEKQAEESQ